MRIYVIIEHLYDVVNIVAYTASKEEAEEFCESSNTPGKLPRYAYESVEKYVAPPPLPLKLEAGKKYKLAGDAHCVYIHTHQVPEIGDEVFEGNFIMASSTESGRHYTTTYSGLVRRYRADGTYFEYKGEEVVNFPSYNITKEVK